MRAKRLGPSSGRIGSVALRVGMLALVACGSASAATSSGAPGAPVTPATIRPLAVPVAPSPSPSSSPAGAMATPCTLLLKPPGTTIPVSLPDAVPDTTRLGATRAMTRTIVMAPAVEASALRDGAVYAEAVLTCPRNVSDFTNVALSVRAAPPGGLALTLLYEKVAVTSK